jgi:hypothetical protein
LINPDYSVPDDFPRPKLHSSVAGYQAKLPLVASGGRFYLPGSTPRELHSRWDICEDMAQQFVVKSRECKSGKRAHMSEEEILDQYCVRVLKTGWGSDDEMKWVIRRAAAILGWPIPASAAQAGDVSNHDDGASA